MCKSTKVLPFHAVFSFLFLVICAKQEERRNRLGSQYLKEVEVLCMDIPAHSYQLLLPTLTPNLIRH